MLSILALSFVGCSDNDDESEEKKSFTVTSTDIDLTLNNPTIPVRLSGKEYKIVVAASESVSWQTKVTEGEDFITVTSTEEQKGNGEISIKVAANETIEEREGVVVISNSLGNSNEITFQQEAEIDKTFSFAVMGDLHYGLNKDGVLADVRTPRALKMILEKQPAVKAIFICGDFTNGGEETQYQKITELVGNNVPSSVNVFYMLGNHDTYQDAASSFYNSYVKQPLHQYIEKGGYPFITISVDHARKGSADYSTEATTFLKDKLVQATKDYPGKPVFVFSHSPSQLTPWGARWGYNTLHEILKKYPQAVHFTGHTHFTVEDERSIWQGDYTWMNVGPSHYANIQKDITNSDYPASGNKVTEAVIVDLQQNTDIKITRLDTYHEKVIKENKPWLIEAPHDGSKFKYTNSRNGGEHPRMNTKPTVSDITELSCNVTFPQGTDDDLLYHYIVEAVDVSTQQVAHTGLVFSHFYLREEKPATLDWKISGLKAGTNYIIRIKGVDSFNNQSEPIASDAFKTLSIGDIDPSAKAPKADMIDVAFSPATVNGGASNIAAASPVVSKIGNGAPTAYNQELKRYVGQYAGVATDLYKLDYSSTTDFVNKLKDGFTFEVYCKTTDLKTMQYAFSNLQGAGIGLVIKEAFGTAPDYFQALVHDGTAYHRVDFGRIEANKYYHYVFTFDGEMIRLYQDGKLVNSEACTKLNMPGSTSAQYFCVGADSSTGGKGNDALKGEIAIARIFDKAANNSEVFRLYEQINTRKVITKFNDLNTALTITIPGMTGADKDALLKEGWDLMNNAATTQASIESFLAKVAK